MKHFIYLFSVMLVLVSCSKDVFHAPTDQKSFSMTNQVAVNVNTTTDSTRCVLYTEYPYNEHGNVIANPVLIGYTPIETTVTIPTAVKTLYIEVNGILKTYQRGDITINGSVLPAQTKAVTDDGITTIDDGLYTYVRNIYPNGIQNIADDKMGVCTDLKINTDNTKVRISFILAGGGYPSKLYYYTYTDGDTTAPTEEELHLIFDNNKNVGEESTSPIPLGSTKDLGTFNKGTKIGFALQETFAEVGKYKYTTPIYNTVDANSAGKTLGVIRSISFLGERYHTLGMEDSFQWADWDYDDFICLIETDPKDAAAPENTLPAPPFEVGRKIIQGVWMFEDNYPSEGDYDFNDAVVMYYIEELDKASTATVYLRVAATGATFANRFGINDQWLIQDGSLTGFKNVYAGFEKEDTPILTFTLPISATSTYVPMLDNTLWTFDKYTYNKYNPNFPYVLDVPEAKFPSTDFKWCLEKIRIDAAYPKYKSWVENGCGEVDSDWYKYPDLSKVYDR
ncbi:MAG: LruC domain-containing protein [Prevotellaceae bacterium]|jgi:hypothetical protein|nr:LruC domain-containing protein [Prevotellaceae bacterium]